jgi:hypothetical protein
MPMSTHEEQREELDMAEAAYDAEAEEELVGKAASSEHYSALANRLFSEVHDVAQELKAPSTLVGYQGCLLVNPRYHRLGSNFFFSQIKKFKAFARGLGSTARESSGPSGKRHAEVNRGMDSVLMQPGCRRAKPSQPAEAWSGQKGHLSRSSVTVM